MVPPPYPRTPYLWAPADGTGGDRVLDEAEVPGWLHRPVTVEEKLDGANVAIWVEQGRLEVAGRGGADAMDRGRQLGALRSRVNAGYAEFTALLDRGLTAYGEWLWLTHSVRYDSLPDHLVILDLWEPAGGFVSLPERDLLCQRHGLLVPPRLFDGVLGSAEALLALLGRSRFGSAPMEGAVLRRDDGQRCKVLRPGFERVPDAEIGRVRNTAT